MLNAPERAKVSTDMPSQALILPTCSEESYTARGEPIERACHAISSGWARDIIPLLARRVSKRLKRWLTRC